MNKTLILTLIVLVQLTTQSFATETLDVCDANKGCSGTSNDNNILTPRILAKSGIYYNYNYNW